MKLLFFLIIPFFAQAAIIDKEYKCETRTAVKSIQLKYNNVAEYVPCEVVRVRDHFEEKSWYFDKRPEECQYQFIESLLELTRQGYKCKRVNKELPKPKVEDKKG
jgi:hypothetical protein